MLTAAASPHALAPSGDELLAHARTGSDSAFAALVREHQAMVFGLAYHALRSRAQAEELAQDVFLALFQNLPRVESARHLVFWLRRVTSNRCIDSMRSAHRRRELPIDELHEPSVPPRVNDPLLGELLRTLVAELAPDARMVVTLRFQEDLDLSEIAAILDMPVNTVKSHLRRSMDALRRGLADKGHVYES
jgi:RNA polymerase sigma-70 factor (ECF subfamily)